MPLYGGYGFDQVPQQNFDYPVQESYQNNLGQAFQNSLQTPAMDAYQGYLSDAPRYEDYQGGFLQKLLASLAGASVGIRNPLAGVQTSLGIMDAPYLRALSQYQSMEPGYRQAATIEERSLGDRINALRYQQEFERDKSRDARSALEFEQNKEFQRQQLAQALQIAEMNNSRMATQDANQAAHYRNMEGIQREGNMLDTLQALNPLNILKNFGKPQGQSQPSAANTELVIMQRMLSDPRMQSAFDDEGNFMSGRLTPEQLAVLQQIQREVGIFGQR